MDANRPTPLKTPWPLVALCAVVAAACLVWQAWDMFGSARKPMLQGWDDSFYYFWLPSVVIDGDVDFSNQLTITRSIKETVRQEALTAPRTPTGLLPNKYPPGWALGSLPFFLAAHVFAPDGSTGFEPVYLVSVWLGQLLYAIGGLVLAAQILRRFFGPDFATPSVLLVWLASPLVYYQTARLSMSHSQVFALAMAAFWLALRIADGAPRAWHWAALGFVSALLVVTRNVAIVYLAMPAVVVLRHLRSFKPGLLLVAGAALPTAVQLTAWKLLYGEWLVYSYGGERFDFSNLHLAEILFSPRHGWFYWHPLLLPAITAFLVWAWRRSIGLAWLASLALAIVLNAAWPMWWLGSSFGHRGLEVSVFFAMLGLAALFQSTRTTPWLHRALWFVCGLAAAWNLLLLTLSLGGRISRYDPVTYRDTVTALWLWITLR